MVRYRVITMMAYSYMHFPYIVDWNPELEHLNIDVIDTDVIVLCICAMYVL